MMIGVDFDNTIVCYDEVFHTVAVEEGLLPPGARMGKGAVRDRLRAAGRDDDWTALQGLVYGARIAAASPYPGVLDFFRGCAAAGVPVCVVSHKTRHPFLGPRHDLHAAAYAWLERYGFFDPAGIGLPADRVFFELTRTGKLARIGAAGCSVFIDDLPEFLAEPGFPADVERILFDPHERCAVPPGCRRLTGWATVARHLLPARESA